MSHNDSKHPRTKVLHHPAKPDVAAEHSTGETAHHERPSHSPHHERGKAHSHSSPSHPHHEG